MKCQPYSVFPMNDLTGQRFGRLIVVQYLGNRRYLVECDCSIKKSVYGYNLLSGDTASCGCLRKERTAAENRKARTHGMTETRLYYIWRGMKRRCYEVGASGYNDYGGRGIKVCDEWFDPTTFIEWALFNGYDDNLQIERSDHDGNYSPENCRWVTVKTNQNNKRNSKFETAFGETKTQAEWMVDPRNVNKSIQGLRHRLKRGMSMEEALTTPVGEI